MNYVIGLSIAAVTVALLLGLWNLLRAGSPSQSQKLMRWRVILQFAAVVVMMGAIWWQRGGF